MSPLDGSKRPRTDDSSSSPPSPISAPIRPLPPQRASSTGGVTAAMHDMEVDTLSDQLQTSPTAMSTAAAATAAAATAAANSNPRILSLLEQIVVSQERLAADVSRLQSSMDTVLASLGTGRGGHSLASIVTPRDSHDNSLPPLSALPHSSAQSGGLPSSSGQQARSPSASPRLQHGGSQQQSARDYHRPATGNPATSFYNTPPPPTQQSMSISLPPPAALARNPGFSTTTPGMMRSAGPSQTYHHHQQQQQHQHQQHPQHQHQQHQQSASKYMAPQMPMSARPHSPPHPKHSKPPPLQQYPSRYSYHPPPPSSAPPHQTQQQQSISLPPIRQSPAHPSHAPNSASAGMMSQKQQQQQQQQQPPSMLGGPSATAAAAAAAAAHQHPSDPSATPPKPTLVMGGRQMPPAMMSPHGPPGGLAHAPPSSAPPTMTHHMMHQRSATPGSSKLSPPGQQNYSQLKLEKNRFQANIRSFVDQHFMAPGNPQWDYQQSFKSPRNAQVTQQIVHAFYNAHGGTVERIEHGLSVYFSSLKAKHRTTEDKALLKQQRDRRRARRIKKAAGRRKVFDRTQYPFLPAEFDPSLAFVPSAMSPEHTDDDGEVKVGSLEWRAPTYTKLFKLLDTLRPKRTPRPNNPYLKGSAAPPPEIPSIMIDPAYAALDRVAEEQHDMDEDESDEDADSHTASMYM